MSTKKAEKNTEIKDEVTEMTDVENTVSDPVEVEEKKPAKKRRAKAPAVEPVAEPEASKTEETPKAPEKVEKNKQEMSSEKVAEKKEVKAPTTAPASERRKKKTVANDPYRDTRALLKGNKQTLTILSGTLECMEFENNMKEPEHAVCAITYYEGFRVVIPAGCMGLDVSMDLPAQDRAAMYKKFINAMLASRIEYVVRMVDDKNNVAIGDRNIALSIRRKQYYLNKRASGKSIMQTAMERQTPVEAYVTAVSGSVVRVEVYGVECKVFAKEAAWRYTANLSTLFCPGDKVNVIVKNIEIDDNTVHVDVSIREATPNRQLENISHFKPGSVCTGMITGATQKGYYIAVGDTMNGIDAFCNLVHGTEIPQVGDRVICQLVNINTVEGYATAKITRIIQHSKF